MARSVCQTCPTSQCPELRRQEAKLNRFDIDAHASEQVYEDDPKPPEGYRNATDDDLKKMGVTRDYIDRPIDPKTGEKTDFKAAVFVNNATGEKLVAFRGSTLAKQDWTTNAEQAMGKETFYYTRAQDIGKRIADSPGETRFTGHSLGGGLASAASRATGGDASTFNSAGLHGNTVKDPNTAGHIDAVNVKGEVLTSAQMIPGLSKAASSESWPLDPPPSLGTMILTRAASTVFGIKGYLAAKAIRSGDLHRMVRVQEALKYRRQQNIAALKKNNC